MRDKYGLVNYHIGENSYIDMDKPDFDNTRNRINKNK